MFPQSLTSLRHISSVRVKAALLAGLIGAPGIAKAEPVVVGAVERAQGSVSATQAGAARALDAGGAVLFQDRLRTGAASRLEAKLADDTVLTLGENGRLTVDEFVYRPGTTGGKLGVTVAKGAFLFVGGKIEGPTGGNVAIRTPVGTLGVRGTTVWGGQIDGGYGVMVVSGEVDVQTRRGTIKLRAGESTMIYAKRRNAGPAAWPEDRVKRAIATVTFAR